MAKRKEALVIRFQRLAVHDKDELQRYTKAELIEALLEVEKYRGLEYKGRISAEEDAKAANGRATKAISQQQVLEHQIAEKDKTIEVHRALLDVAEPETGEGPGPAHLALQEYNRRISMDKPHCDPFLHLHPRG